VRGATELFDLPCCFSRTGFSGHVRYGNLAIAVGEDDYVAANDGEQRRQALARPRRGGC
jgi:hypothetical protein